MGKASRKKQERYEGVDGNGRPLFPGTTRSTPQVSGVPLSWLLAVVTISFWVGAHLLGPYSNFAGIGYVTFGILLGLANPGLGAAIVIALVPFYGGEMSQGLGELVRTAPILGSATRLLYERFKRSGNGSAPWAPDGRVVSAAALVMLLYPLTRITGNGTSWAPDSTLLDDTLFLVGAPVAMYATWITTSHLPRSIVNRVLGVLPFALTAALIVAVGTWAGITLLDPFAFKGIVYGRLAALGYPTPTGMGVAIALPLAVGTLWSRSNRAATLLALLGVVTIILTESRGPLLALLAASAVMALLSSGIPRRYIVGGAFVAVGAFSVLLLVRYPDLLQKLSHGRLPKLRGDELRITSWLAGVQIAIEHPITGGGWMSVRGWNGGELGGRGVNLSHNIVLQGLADGGFILGGAVLTVLVSSLRGAWARRRSIPVYWIGAAVTLLVCGLWDMPHLRAYGAVMGGLALGLVARKIERENDGE